MKPLHLTKSDFLEKIANFETSPKEWHFLGERPALIDFYAEWCGPCKSLASVLEEVAEEYKGKIDVYKVNIEQEELLAAIFNVRSIPTLLFCPKGANPQVFTGAMSKKMLQDAINKVLLGEAN